MRQRKTAQHGNVEPLQTVRSFNLSTFLSRYLQWQFASNINAWLHDKVINYLWFRHYFPPHRRRCHRHYHHHLSLVTLISVENHHVVNSVFSFSTSQLRRPQCSDLRHVEGPHVNFTAKLQNTKSLVTLKYNEAGRFSLQHNIPEASGVWLHVFPWIRSRLCSSSINPVCLLCLFHIQRLIRATTKTPQTIRADIALQLRCLVNSEPRHAPQYVHDSVSNLSHLPAVNYRVQRWIKKNESARKKDIIYLKWH